MRLCENRSSPPRCRWTEIKGRSCFASAARRGGCVFVSVVLWTACVPPGLAHHLYLMLFCSHTRTRPYGIHCPLLTDRNTHTCAHTRASAHALSLSPIQRYLCLRLLILTRPPSMFLSLFHFLSLSLSLSLSLCVYPHTRAYTHTRTHTNTNQYQFIIQDCCSLGFRAGLLPAFINITVLLTGYE